MLVDGYGRCSEVYRQAVPKRRKPNNIRYVTTQPIEDLICTAAEARSVTYLRKTFVTYTVYVCFPGVTTQCGCIFTAL